MKTWTTWQPSFSTSSILRLSLGSVPSSTTDVFPSYRGMVKTLFIDSKEDILARLTPGNANFPNHAPIGPVPDNYDKISRATVPSTSTGKSAQAGWDLY